MQNSRHPQQHFEEYMTIGEKNLSSIDNGTPGGSKYLILVIFPIAAYWNEAGIQQPVAAMIHLDQQIEGIFGI